MPTNILREAEEVIFQRQGSYDAPENNFRRIVKLWNAYLDGKAKPLPLDEKDVAMMMVLMKIGREVFKHKKDNLVDGVGYLQCAMIIEDSRESCHAEKKGL
jgi:hypothetical protein